MSPVEKCWAWLPKGLRKLDLKDAVAKRPVLGKTAYKAKVKRVCKSKKAQRVAINVTTSLKKTCLEVIAKKGAATSG